jgi:hypothetical protein
MGVLGRSGMRVAEGLPAAFSALRRRGRRIGAQRVPLRGRPRLLLLLLGLLVVVLLPLVLPLLLLLGRPRCPLTRHTIWGCRIPCMPPQKGRGRDRLGARGVDIHGRHARSHHPARLRRRGVRGTGMSMSQAW